MRITGTFNKGIMRRGRLLAASLILACLIALLTPTALTANPGEVTFTVSQVLAIAGGSAPPSRTILYKLTPEPESEAGNFPMPEGGSVFTITGTDDAEIKITFTQRGTYTYKLRNITAPMPGYTYDREVFDLEIIVTSDLFTAFVAKKSNGDKTGGILFNHSYKTPGPHADPQEPEPEPAPEPEPEPEPEPSPEPEPTPTEPPSHSPSPAATADFGAEPGSPATTEPTEPNPSESPSTQPGTVWRPGTVSPADPDPDSDPETDPDFDAESYADPATVPAPAASGGPPSSSGNAPGDDVRGASVSPEASASGSPNPASMIDPRIPIIRFGNTGIPLFGGSNKLVWSLVNLILCVSGFIFAVITGIRALLRRKRERIEAEDSYIPAFSWSRDSMSKTRAHGGIDPLKDKTAGNDGGLPGRPAGKEISPKNNESVIISRLRRIEAGGDDPQDKKTRQKLYRLVWVLAVLVAGISGVALFILTENMKLMMVLLDWWTIVNAALFAIEVFCMSLAFKREKNEDTDPDISWGGVADAANV